MLQGCHFEWFSIENCIEKCFEVMRLIQLSISFTLSFLFCIAQSRSIGRNQSPKLWGLGLFLCLRKLQKRLPHAKQTVSLVLCSIILSSPLFCFPNSIKSRPFFFVSRNLSLQGCQFEWFSIENCIEKCFEVRCLIEFSIQISLFSKVKFTCLPRNAGRLELTCIQTYQSWVFTVHHSLFNILYSVSTTHH